MATEPHRESEDRLSVSARRAALRMLTKGLFPDGFRADHLTPKGRAEVREAIDVALVLYDDLKT